MLYSISNLNKRRKRDKGYRLLIKHLEIPAGAKIAITGPSGCGKSTTLDILGLALSPDSADKFIFAPSGETINLADLWKSGRSDILSRLRLNYLGYVLQTGELLSFLTAGENICLIPQINGQNPSKLKEQALKLAEQLGIAHLWKAMPETLSVGERQRVAIARALIARPGVILADEPTAALDPMHARRVMDIFLQCIEEFGTALLLATHDRKWALAGGFTEVPFELQEDSAGVTAVIDSSTC